jgi:phosphoadenosine phosphosulfate reductase
VIASDKKNAVKILANDNDLQRKLFEDCKLKGERVVNPIIDWNEEDVWRFIKERGVPYNPLYDEGWKRIGCVGCPMGSPDQRKRQFERWPKFKENYIRAIERGMERGRAEGIEYTWGGGRERFDFWTIECGGRV